MIGLGVIVWFLYHRRAFSLGSWRADGITLNTLAGTVTIRPDHEVIRIAHQAWVELVTRKVGLPFDEENDVIVEVYNSWYEVFREIRALAKGIPAEKMRTSEDANLLVQTLIETLNNELRPHLTRWQAKFRKWYGSVSNQEGGSPQEIQRMYPEYSALVSDLKRVNDRMVQLTAKLGVLAHGGK